MTVRSGCEPIRILHVVPDLEAGGLQNGVVQVINGLEGDGFHHEVCCLRGAGRVCGQLGPSVRVHELHAGWHDPRIPFRLARVIRRYHPDILHARNWSTWPDTALARKLARQGPLIFSFHGWDSDVPAGLLRGWACRRLAAWTDQLCSVSAHAARLFAAETGLDPQRFEILANGVDVNRFAPRPDGPAVRRELGIDADALTIGSVGRLEGIKDHGLLLRAVARLIHRHGIACQLLLVGDGGERVTWERLAGDLEIADRVRFAGWRDDVPRLLGAMDVFAMTSRREGMNNAILEAMATGLPVVATAVGGNSELVEHGHQGRLIQPGDLAGLVHALAELVRDPSLRRQMGTRARLRVVRSFSLDRALRAYAQTYRRVFLSGEHVSTPGITLRRHLRPA